MQQILLISSLVFKAVDVLEKLGFERAHIVAFVLLGALVIDSLLITLLTWVRYIIFLGLLGVPLNAFLKRLKGKPTTFEDSFARTIDEVHHIPGMLADDSDDGVDGESGEEVIKLVSAEGSPPQ